MRDHNHNRQILLDEDSREPVRALLQSIGLRLLELIEVAELRTGLVGWVKLPGFGRRNSRSGRGNCDMKAASASETEATRVLAELNYGSPAAD